MMQLIHDFHFLRPAWLLALIPLALLLWWLQRRQHAEGNWQQIINPALLAHLADHLQTTQRRKTWSALGIIWLASTLALAGPSWKKLPQPVLQQKDAMVIVLDLTLSMYAQDEVPSRLVHAQRKLTDILARRKEGLTALVVFSGDAHTVTPLTDDTATINAMVASLAPDLMPVFGSNAASGVNEALKLFEQSGIRSGRILLMTDEVLPNDGEGIKALLASRDYSLSIMGIGTQDGAPIAKPDGGFLKRSDGSIIVARLNRDALSDLASTLRGRYSDSSIDDSDIDYLLPAITLDADTRETDNKFDLWSDEGHYLVWLPLLLALYSFRRGVVAGIALLLCLPSPSQALEWADLWQRPDQQAQQAMQQQQFENAAKKFDDPAWKAAALYRAGKFDDAASTLKALDDDNANYNRGNALAQAGKLEDALAAYDRALQQNPANEDAKINRQLVKDAIEQQKQQQQKQQQNQQDGDKSEQSDKNADQQQSSEQNQSDQNASSQQDSQQQGSQQQDSQQQNSQQQDSQQPGDQQQQSQPSDSQQQSAQNQNDSAAQKDQASATPDSEDEAKQQNAEQQQQAQQNQNADSKKDDEALQQAIARQEQQRQQEDAPQENANAPLQATLTPQNQQQTEAEQALEQWLRRVPDDPGGLMRNKFNYQYRVNQREGKHIQDQEQVW